MKPFVSVVMPSFNQAEFIAQSIDSVLSQYSNDIELIISDGGSSDGTQDILQQKAEEAEGCVRWISEPDRGPAHALNKSLSKVRGQIIGWLNSDDLYTPGAIGRAVEAFQANSDWIMCYGHGEHIDAQGQSLGPYPTRRPEVGLSEFRSGCFICQPTMFFKTPVLTMLGLLDETLKTTFDYEYWLRAFTAFPERIGFVDALQAQSRLHDECITKNLRRTIALEGLQLGKAHLGRAELHWATTYLEELRLEIEPSEDRHSFIEEAKSFLDAAKSYLDPSDIDKLRSVIA